MTERPTQHSSPLKQPLTLPCGLVLPNRLVKAAMTEALADDWGRPTPKLCHLYKVWADTHDQGPDNFTGTLITGNVLVDRRRVERPGNVCIDQADPQYDTPEGRALLRRYAEAGGSSSRMIVQLSHAGRQSNGMINLDSVVGPGNIRLDMPAGRVAFGTPRALERTEVEQDIVPRFVYAAQKCQEAGFDGVQIHAAHGYLLSSFLNPKANNRIELFGADDPYGGSLENRARLLLTVVEAVRKATRVSEGSSSDSSKPFAVMVKLNSADFQKGGFTTQEAVQVAVWLEQAGVDMIEISGGNYETGAYYVSDSDKQHNSATPTQHKRESTQRREAFFLEYALQIQAAITKTPVMVTGGWRTRSAMEAAVHEGDCALIGLGRPLCGYPAGGAELLAGTVEELPSYEESLPAADWLTRLCSAICCCGRKRLGPLLQMLALQSWCYCNMVTIAETSKAHKPGTLRMWQAVLTNGKHEINLAKNLKGVDCSGNVYKGKRTS